MRYYSIQIGATATSPPTDTFTSFVNGLNDPGALLVELDLPVAPYATPGGASAAFVKIWGIGLQNLATAARLNGKFIKVFGGMQRGLPLAQPTQNGLLVAGRIEQAFGNWVGTEMSLDLLLTSAGASQDDKNLAFSWPAGTKMSDMVKATLAAAFPSYSADVRISDRLVLGANESGFYSNIYQFAAYLKDVSQSILDPNSTSGYQGVQVTIRERTFSVYDGTAPKAPKLIAFTDLIGQPTWLGPGEIQVKCVMRADIAVGSYIQLPPGQVTVTAASLSQYRDKSVLQGVFQVDIVRHVGSSRQADASSWVTNLNCHPAQLSSGATT